MSSDDYIQVRVASNVKYGLAKRARAQGMTLSHVMLQGAELYLEQLENPQVYVTASSIELQNDLNDIQALAARVDRRLRGG